MIRLPRNEVPTRYEIGCGILKGGGSTKRELKASAAAERLDLRLEEVPHGKLKTAQSEEAYLEVDLLMPLVLRINRDDLRMEAAL